MDLFCWVCITMKMLKNNIQTWMKVNVHFKLIEHTFVKRILIMQMTFLYLNFENHKLKCTKSMQENLNIKNLTYLTEKQRKTGGVI